MHLDGACAMNRPVAISGLEMSLAASARPRARPARGSPARAWAVARTTTPAGVGDHVAGPLMTARNRIGQACRMNISQAVYADAA